MSLFSSLSLIPFIAGLSKKIHAPLGIIEAEAKAFETGINFAKEVGIREFVLEGDSLTITIVQALKECSPALSSVSNLVYGMLAECLNVMSLEM